jgi:hypothetical protein
VLKLAVAALVLSADLLDQSKSEAGNTTQFGELRRKVRDVIRDLRFYYGVK